MPDDADDLNPYQRYRAEMDRVADQLGRAGKLAFARGDVMRGRVSPDKKRTYLSRQSSARFEIAKRRLGVRGLCLEKDKPLLRVQVAAVTDTNDGVYVSPRLEKPFEQTEVAHWLNKIGWNIRQCGRSAVGVGLLRRDADLPGEKVYHATCKDWMCAGCNARRMAHEVPALKTLMTEEFNDRRRLFFATLTVRHKYNDLLESTRAVLDRAWALLIRRKWFRDTFDERLRVAETEFTKTAGFHPHFHLLLRMRPGCKAWYWSRDKVYEKLMSQWRSCTATAGRESWKIDLRELVAVRDAAGEIQCVRYWLRPNERKRFEKLERDGLVKLYRDGPCLMREQSLGDVVAELCKYVTNRHKNGKKPNQVPLDEWQDWMTVEYRLGLRWWNRRRASKGWEQRLIELKEDAELEREIEQDEAGGYEYYPWAAIVALCRKAVSKGLTSQESETFAADLPRIHEALSREGCDVSAGMIEGYIAHYFGNTKVPLAKLILRPWDRAEWNEEQHARRLDEAQVERRLKSRHWRVLLRVRRRLDAGASTVKLSGLGMSRRRLASCVEYLENEGLLQVHAESSAAAGAKARTRYSLTDSGRRLLPTKLPDPREKHAARKALRELQRMLPGMTFLEG